MPIPVRKRFYWLRKRWAAILMVSAAVALLLALLHARESEAQATCFSTGQLSWPVPYERGLGNNYMQFQIEGLCHEGVDILAAPDTPVVAIEGGYLVLSSDPDYEMGPDPNYWMVIESDSNPGVGFLYQHLNPTNKFALFVDHIDAGTELGTVAQYPEPDFDHLHLGRVRGFEDAQPEPVRISEAEATWIWCLPESNPLALLEKPDDSEAPVFLADQPYLASEQGCDPTRSNDKDWPFWFRDDKDIASESSTPAYHCPDALPQTAMDIVCKISDFTSSEADLNISPCCGRVTVQPESGDPPWENEIAFDGEQRWDVPYVSYLHDNVLQSTGMFADARTLYLVVTNDPYENGSWTPTTSGNYVVTIEIQDAAGNSTQRSMTVTVQ